MATETELLREVINANGGACDDLPDNLKSTLYKKLINVCSAGGGGTSGSGGTCSWNDLTDKPFGVEVIHGDVPVFNGDLNGKEYIQMDDYTYLVKISEKCVTEQYLIGQTIVTYDFGLLNEKIIEEGDFYKTAIDEDNYFIMVANSIYIVKGDLTSLGIPVAEGIWFVMYANPNNSVEKQYIKSLTGVTDIEKIHQINEKFLPRLIGKMGSSFCSEVFNDINNTASSDYTHAEGNETTASGSCSHAEGCKTTASGDTSHAEGNETTASGSCSHAECNKTTASGNSSHAEGYDTTASGSYSHAEGYGTIAAKAMQHVFGACNIEDTGSTSAVNYTNSGKYVHIVGNGTSKDNRSNAHTLDWDGNAWYQGTVECTGVLLASPNGTKFKVTVSDDGTLTTTEL